MMNSLRRIWRPVFGAWMAFAHVLGIVNTTILLTIVYLIVILPMRAVFLALGKDPLRLRAFRSGPAWADRDPEGTDINERSHPF